MCRAGSAVMLAARTLADVPPEVNLITHALSSSVLNINLHEKMCNGYGNVAKVESIFELSFCFITHAGSCTSICFFL